MLALDPELVRSDRLAHGWTGDLTAVQAHGVAAVSEQGVLGDPTAATAAEGHEVLDDLTADLLARFDEWCRPPP